MPRPVTIEALARRLDRGETSALALLDETLARLADQADPAIVTRRTEARARREAAAADDRRRAGRALGVLDGIPTAHKDLFDMMDEVTTSGSLVLADAPAAAVDAPVVAALAKAGMVSFARLNMSEFAFSGIGFNPHFGTPANPWSTDGLRAPGGSSSGTAVLIARGIVPAALGSDTGGSVRIPAAFNGIVGLKTSHGRYPTTGAYPLSHSLDTIGPLASCVGDCALLDAALRGAPPVVPSPGAIAGTTLVIPTNRVMDDLEPAVAANFEAAARRLEARGARLESRAFPAFAEMQALFDKAAPFVAIEAYAGLRHLIESDASARMDHRVVNRARLARDVRASDYIDILRGRARLVPDVAATLPRGTFVIFPTVPHVAPLVAPLAADDDRFVAVNARTLRNTLVGNFLDWCGLSIPDGTGEAGMPTGFLVSAARGEEDALVAFGLAAEPVIRG